MITRIKFTKSGPLKFIGHLDIMRYFQKAFRRADLDVEYSQGFSPHQLMSFAAPLGVGLTSDGEYLDVQLKSCDSAEEMISRINEAMADDIRVVDFRIMPENSRNAMSIVAAADYLVSLKDGYEFMEKEAFETSFQEFFNQEVIIINKKTKKSEGEKDIKPFIYHTAYTSESFYEGMGYVPSEVKSVAEDYQNGIKVYMELATGSVNNLKPELVMEAFCSYAGIPFLPFSYQVHRLEVYAEKENGEQRELVALNQVS